MPSISQVKPPNPYEGNYHICLKDNPQEIIKTQYITSQEEFRTILDEVIKYNNAFGNEGPLLRKLIKD